MNPEKKTLVLLLKALQFCFWAPRTLAPPPLGGSSAEASGRWENPQKNTAVILNLRGDGGGEFQSCSDTFPSMIGCIG